MARRPSRVHAYAFDHLHSRSPALAGFASEAADDAAARGWIPRRRRDRRSHPSAPRRLVAATLTALLAGVGVLFGGALPAGAADPQANTVLAFAGAPQLGPNPGLALNAALIDLAPTRSGRGYWAVASDGGVFTYGDARFHGSTGGMPLVSPIAGIASTQSSRGYWLVAYDGGVFSFGDARFRGSMGGQRLVSPIAAMATTRSGRGYWLVAFDGGVFSFGDAKFYGSMGGKHLTSPIVSIATTRTGRGYYLVAADGGVFSFGDAKFRGAISDPKRPASGIAVARNGGYWIAREDGTVDGFGVPSSFGAAGPDMQLHPTIAIAPAARGFWLAQGSRARPVAPPAPDVSQHPFLVCTRRIESGGNYRALSPGGTYRGAYQFLQSTWNSVARSAGRPDLVGVDPAAAAPWDQDQLALHLYRSSGAGPWGGRCAGR